MPGKYVCDAMLGRLARWLRLLGYDVTYPKQHDSDKQLLEYTVTQKRSLITRDFPLIERARKIGLNVIPIHHTSLHHQLREFATAISPSEPLQLQGTRCSLCNTPLILTNPEHIRTLQSKLQNQVHEKTLKRQQQFWYCPNCYQAFWKGRQWDRIMDTLEKINTERSLPVPETNQQV